MENVDVEARKISPPVWVFTQMKKSWTELDNRPMVFNAATKENANSIPPYVAKRSSQGDTAL